MNEKLEVIFEDNHLLVVNKPPMLATMGVKAGNDSLVNRAKTYLKNKYNKPGNVYLGVVSRLDSFVSGVIVLARTSKAAARLNQQFASASTQKRYWAIVPSRMCQDDKSLRHWLIKDEANHRMMTSDSSTPGAKIAELKYHRLGEFEDKSLIEIELITGRKHQIRVQLSATGMTIIGDRKYGSKSAFKSGIALHSFQLTIEHPTLKETMVFQKEPPYWWQIERFIQYYEKPRIKE